jgi:hypothetical protein
MRIDGKLVTGFVSVGEAVSVLPRKTHRLPVLHQSVKTIRGLNAEQQRGKKMTWVYTRYSEIHHAFKVVLDGSSSSGEYVVLPLPHVA